MKVNAGDWCSLRWDVSDFNDKESFEQFNKAPRFIYAEHDCLQIESELINKFNKARLVSIEITTVFIKEKDGIFLPTHYRFGEFMPGDRPKYDQWLAEYHKIAYTASERVRDKEKLQQRKIYLDYVAKVIRHDLHSGINTYLPRGLEGLLRKIPEAIIKELKLQPQIHLLKSGLEHTRKVYKNVYAFTSLVRNQKLEKEEVDIEKSLKKYIENTAYLGNVEIAKLPIMKVNEVLFVTALDNLIKGGLTNNYSEVKTVKIYMEKDVLCVEDNGVGLSKENFIKYCRPYYEEGKEYHGLELNIAVSIIKEHGFKIDLEEIEKGTKFLIYVSDENKYFIDNTDWIT